jgi:hypothetical protein
MNILDIGVEAEGLAILEREWKSGRLHVTEAHLDMIAPVAEAMHRMALRERHARPSIADVSQKHDGLMHDLIVSDVMQQHR